MFKYLESDRVKEITEIVLARDIHPRLLLTSCDPAFVAALPVTDNDADDLLLAIHRLNCTRRLADDSVPLLHWLSLLICSLNGKNAPEIGAVIEIAREVYARLPIASQRFHVTIGDLLFQQENSDPAAPPDSSGPRSGCTEPPPPSSHHGGICTNPLSPSNRPSALCSRAPVATPGWDAAPVDPDLGPMTVHSSTRPQQPSTPSIQPRSAPAPVRAPTIFTLATAGAAGGGAIMIQMVFFPVDRAAGATEQHCALTVIAAMPLGALAAVYLWSVAEAIARTRARPEGRLLRYLFISVGALIGGGALSLLAHALADMAFTTSASPAWVPLGISAAVGSLFAGWSRGMARPTTVFRALATAAVATGGTYLGYLAYARLVGLLGGNGRSFAPLRELTRQSPVIAAGAFVFVAVTQIMMSLQIHGVDAFDLRSRALALKPIPTLVPKSVLPMTALGALALALTVLGSSCSMALRASVP
jgi:hypothetical protein